MTQAPSQPHGSAVPLPPPTTPWWPRGLVRRLRQLGHRLRTEGDGAERETAAFGLGVFIGCLPFYGFHLLICAIAGWLLGVNRLKMYLAANISNPLVAPWLVLAETEVGARLRHGAFIPLTREGLSMPGLPTLAADLLTGSVVVGASLGALAATATFLMRRGADRDSFRQLVREAADRYAATSLTAWEFARSKLVHDPVYRAAACEGLLPSGGTLLDLGCGQGLMLAILAVARRRAAAYDWPGPPLPLFAHLVGVETNARAASRARTALGADASIVTGDVRVLDAVRADAILLFDVLHMMAEADQNALIARLVTALEPGGIMLVREADAAAGRRFTAVRVVNRLKALVTGRPRQVFHFRTADQWQACFAQHGLQAEAMPMGSGTPFANVLIRATRPRQDA